MQIVSLHKNVKAYFLKWKKKKKFKMVSAEIFTQHAVH